MKKTGFFTILLVLALLANAMLLPVSATATTDSTDSSQTESTEETIGISTTVGSTPITNGCRTIDGQNPLGGMDRMLKTAQAAFVYEVNTQTILYAYNPDLRVTPGTLSKLLTGLIAVEECDLNEVITVSTREISQLPIGAQVVDLMEGEQVTVRDVLYCLLLASANDAALVLAEHITGNEISFVEKMNQRLEELGCTNTHLANCHGLENAQQYTSARDMAKILQACYQNATFTEIISSKTYTVEANNRRKEPMKVETSNHLIYERNLPQFNDSRVTGGMASYVSASTGASIAFTASDKNMDLVFVIMGATRTYKDNGWQPERYGNFEEALDLLDYAFSNYKVNRILYKDQPLNQFSVNGGECSVLAGSQTILDSVVPASAQMDNMLIRYSLENGGLNAPIAVGQKLGTVQIWYDTSCLAETEIYALGEVRAANNTGVVIYGAEQGGTRGSGFLKVLGIILLVILGVAVAYLVVNNLLRYRARRRRRRRRAARRRSR